MLEKGITTSFPEDASFIFNCLIFTIIPLSLAVVDPLSTSMELIVERLWFCFLPYKSGVNKIGVYNNVIQTNTGYIGRLCLPVWYTTYNYSWFNYEIKAINLNISHILSLLEEPKFLTTTGVIASMSAIRRGVIEVEDDLVHVCHVHLYTRASFMQRKRIFGSRKEG